MSHHTLSSTAKRSYWLGRYLERAESTARLLTVTANLLYDLPRRLPLGWRTLIDITGSSALFDELYDENTERNVVRFLVNDQRNPGSLTSSLNWARENTRTLRGIIPRQAVEYVNELSIVAREHLAEPLSRTRRAEGLAEIPEFVQKIDGFMSSNMLHDAHWRFLRIGNFIERADMTSRLVEVGTNDLFEAALQLEPYSDVQWRSVLRALDATQAYATVVQEPINQPAVLEFLLKNADLPRSFAYSLKSLRNSLRALPRNDLVMRELNRLRRRLNNSDVSTLDGDSLREFIDECQIQLGGIHDAINRVYFEFKPRRKPGQSLKSRQRSRQPSHRASGS